MQFVCLRELTDLEKAGFAGAFAIGLILFVLGLILAFRANLWKAIVEGKFKEYGARLPAPLACLALGVACLAVAGWRLGTTFPSNNLSFSQKAWTLGEI